VGGRDKRDVTPDSINGIKKKEGVRINVNKRLHYSSIKTDLKEKRTSSELDPREPASWPEGKEMQPRIKKPKIGETSYEKRQGSMALKDRQEPNSADRLSEEGEGKNRGELSRKLWLS